MVLNKISKKSVEHVQYEIDMLRNCHNFLSRLSPQQQLLINVFLESFAIHARNLFYFFYTGINKRTKDDIIAEDFITNKKLFRSTRTSKRELKIILKKTAKQIAHISYYRCLYNKRTKPWKFGDLYQKLEITIEAFKKSLPTERQSWFN
jgi:hypothetical protein